MNTRFLTIIPALIFFPVLTIAQVIEWQNTIGGNDTDHLYCIRQTSDSGYILGGWSVSNVSGDKTENCFGGHDFWIVKTDSSGNVQWQNTIGGIGGDDLNSIQQTSDGGYILAGTSDSYISGDKTENCIGIQDYWIVKTDAMGGIQWQNTIGGAGNDFLNSIQQTTDGGYILGGYSGSNISGDKTENAKGGADYWIVKTDASGNIQWQNTIGGDGWDGLFSIQQTSDDGFILGGQSTSDISGDKTEICIGWYDYWIIKTDSLGDIQWQNTIGGSQEDNLLSVSQTNDGGYILGGFSYSDTSADKTENSNGLNDFWIIKTDSSGVIQWQNTIGGSADEYLSTIMQTLDGGYILGGVSESNISGDKTENGLGMNDFWVIKTDSSGIIQWQNTIGGNNYDDLMSTSQTSDGGYILGGFSNTTISGDKTEDCLGEQDYWIVKISDMQTSVSEVSEISESLLIYPNPAYSTLFIATGNVSGSESRIIITDVAGRTIYSKPITTSSTNLSIDISTFSKGIYFLQFQVADRISRGMFVKE